MLTLSDSQGKGLLLDRIDPAIPGMQGRIIDQCFENGLLVYPSVGGKEGKMKTVSWSPQPMLFQKLKPSNYWISWTLIRQVVQTR